VTAAKTGVDIGGRSLVREAESTLDPGTGAQSATVVFAPCGAGLVMAPADELDTEFGSGAGAAINRDSATAIGAEIGARTGATVADERGSDLGSTVRATTGRGSLTIWPEAASSAGVIFGASASGTGIEAFVASGVPLHCARDGVERGAGNAAATGAGVGAADAIEVSAESGARTGAEVRPSAGAEVGGSSGAEAGVGLGA
jgi:hypothetical protein